MLVVYRASLTVCRRVRWSSNRPPSTTASRACSVAPCRCPRGSVNDVAARTAGLAGAGIEPTASRL